MCEDGVARLHVGRAAAVEEIAVAPARQVVGDRHRVEVTGEQHPPLPAETGAGQHGVAGAQHLQMGGLLGERCLDEVGQPGLLAGHARHVHQRRAQRDRITRQLQHAFTQPQKTKGGPPWWAPFISGLMSAVSYSPTPCRVQYHRRWRA